MFGRNIRPAVLALLVVAQGQQDGPVAGDKPYRSFGGSPVSLDFAIEPENPSQLTSGALFACPRKRDDSSFASGPLIMTNAGETIWDGTAEPYNFGLGMVFEPGTLDGQQVAAFWQGEFTGAGYGSGHGIIINSTYEIVANVTSTIEGEGLDFHEFQITDNGTALIIIYAPEEHSLSSSGGSDLWIVNAYVQEIDITTGEAVFTWNSLDHLDPSDSYHDRGSDGQSSDNPWDYLHMNSIQKDSSGNYLVSCKHFNALFLLSPGGDILWELGGRHSSFEMSDDTGFHQQHDARWVEEGSMVSLFDNAVSGYDDEKTQAESMFLRIDMDDMKVSLAQAYPPYKTETSPSQGSTRKQPNGDVLSGFGSQPWVVEHNGAGETLWAARYPSKVTSYRVARSAWTGAPTTKPSLYVSPSSSDASTTVYLSWNGDTRVEQWRVYASPHSPPNGSSPQVFAKAGFETVYTFQLDWPEDAEHMNVWAEGVDGHESVLGITDQVALGTDGQGASVTTQSGITHGSDFENSSKCAVSRRGLVQLIAAICVACLCSIFADTVL